MIYYLLEMLGIIKFFQDAPPFQKQSTNEKLYHMLKIKKKGLKFNKNNAKYVFLKPSICRRRCLCCTYPISLQHLTSCFTKSAQLFCLKVSLKKKKVFHQPVSRKKYGIPHITFGKPVFKTVHHFCGPDEDLQYGLKKNSERSWPSLVVLLNS